MDSSAQPQRFFRSYSSRESAGRIRTAALSPPEDLTTTEISTTNRGYVSTSSTHPLIKWDEDARWCASITTAWFRREYWLYDFVTSRLPIARAALYRASSIWVEVLRERVEQSICRDEFREADLQPAGHSRGEAAPLPPWQLTRIPRARARRTPGHNHDDEGAFLNRNMQQRRRSIPHYTHRTASPFTARACLIYIGTLVYAPPCSAPQTL